MSISTDISQKGLYELTLSELAYVHLYSIDGMHIKDGFIQSVLSLVINEIRHIKGQTHANSFTPILSSFAVLDQLGFCYKSNCIKKNIPNGMSPLKKALNYFGNEKLSKKDVKALCALRNSFVHTASQASVCLYGNEDNNFYFIYNPDQKELVNHSLESWNGKFSSLKYDKHVTYINPMKLIELSEQARANAMELLEEGKLEFNFSDGFEGRQEFFYRFLKHTPS